jgi:hypothetical protein
MILVGSTYFFQHIDGFLSKDNDFVEFVENPKTFDNIRHLRSKNECIFQWRKCSANEMIEIHKNRTCGMEIGKFLVPQVCKEIGFTIENLKQLKHLVDNLDEKHYYEKIIYEAYIQNNDFVLSEDQLLLAYNEYKKYRKI